MFLLLPALLLPACGPVEDTRPGQPVAARQKAFKAMMRSFEPMGVQLREQRYEPETFLKHARELAQLKDAPWPHFGPDTYYPPTKASEMVWQAAEKFTAERDQFLLRTDALLQAAESRDEKLIAPAYEAVHESCRSCHKGFRK